MRYLWLILLLPSLAYSQVNIYASPTGSAGNPGTYASPYDLATGLAKMGTDTTLNLKGGIYTLSGYTSWARSGQKAIIRACSGERVIIQATGGYAKDMSVGPDLTIRGIWFGGKVDPDTSQRHGTFSVAARVVFDTCVFWGHDIGVLSAASDSTVVLNSLFAWICRNPLTQYNYHSIYISDSNSGTWNQRDLIFRNVFVKAPVAGYAIHYWHYPSYIRTERNFLGRVNWFTATPPRRDNSTPPGSTNEGDYWPSVSMQSRDNIYWSNDSGYITPRWGDPITLYGDNNTSLITSYNGYRRHELIGKPTTGGPSQTVYTQGPGDTIYWVGPNPYSGYGGGAHPKTGTADSVVVWTGKTQAQLDSAVARLSQYFNDRPNDSILVDTRITTEWNVILSALDYWAEGSPSGFYASASASGGGNGSYANPWTLQEAVTHMHPDTAITVLDGVYRLSGTLTVGTGRVKGGDSTNYSVIRAAAGAYPLITTTDSLTPTIIWAGSTRAVGLWMGGIYTSTTQTTTQAGGRYTVLDSCVFLNLLNQALNVGSYYSFKVLNSMFVNCGWGEFNHSIYISTAAPDSARGTFVQHNVFIGGDRKSDSVTTTNILSAGGGYGIQSWSGADYNYFFNNFVGDTWYGISQWGEARFGNRDNVVWSCGREPFTYHTATSWYTKKTFMGHHFGYAGGNGPYESFDSTFVEQFNPATDLISYYPFGTNCVTVDSTDDGIAPFLGKTHVQIQTAVDSLSTMSGTHLRPRTISQIRANQATMITHRNTLWSTLDTFKAYGGTPAPPEPSTQRFRMRLRFR